MKPIVVTRHAALIELLKEREMIDDSTEIVASCTPDQIRGRHVIGILPLHLAVFAESVTVVQIDAPPELRGRELDLEQTRKYAGPAQTFRVYETTAPARYRRATCSRKETMPGLFDWFCDGLRIGHNVPDGESPAALPAGWRWIDHGQVEIPIR